MRLDLSFFFISNNFAHILMMNNNLEKEWQDCMEGFEGRWRTGERWPRIEASGQGLSKGMRKGAIQVLRNADGGCLIFWKKYGLCMGQALPGGLVTMVQWRQRWDDDMSSLFKLLLFSDSLRGAITCSAVVNTTAWHAVTGRSFPRPCMLYFRYKNLALTITDWASVDPGSSVVGAQVLNLGKFVYPTLSCLSDETFFKLLLPSLGCLPHYQGK